MTICKIAMLSIGVILLHGCGNDANAPAESPKTQKETIKTETQPIKPTPKKTVKATLMLGGEAYEFDFVMCTRGVLGSTSVIASDHSKRKDYPSVRLSVYPEEPATSVSNTMSANFDKATPQVFWKRDSAEIKRTEEGVTASGILQGSEMVETDNGNLRSVPLDQNGRQEFQFLAKC